ncbi:hypothetical protein CKO13_01560 [Halorhodospira neutriphila]|uniref:Tape measure protein N-terminal domain-containing protein n=2 Tax=Halorhodospira neutriphila TaxID=168379 RepID=A0ABS1E430_9GAMM|nr:hypothetical protein [Halorhodospira neutriphila]
MVARLADKVSAPARRIREASGGMAGSLQRTRDELRRVQAQQRKTGQLQSYNQRIRDHAEQLDQANERLAQLKRQYRDTERPTKTLQKQMAAAGKRVSKLSSRHTELRKEAHQVRKALQDEGVDTAKLGDEQTRLNRRAQDLTQSLERQRRVAGRLSSLKSALGSGWERISGRIGRLARFGAWGGGAAAAGTSALGYQAMQAAGGREDFITTLRTIEGSAEAARKASEWVDEFATKTPYQLAEVREAYTKLRAYGMDPTNGLLRTLGDTSAAMGKRIIDSVEAIADAVNGENERLKEFGIKASTSGDLITYRYTDAQGRQQMAQVLKDDRDMIRQTLTRIWRERFGGAMEARSRTWNGMISNLRDQWTRFLNEVAASGPMEELKGNLRSLLRMLNRASEDGRLDRWAEQAGEHIVDAIQTTKELSRWLIKTSGQLQDTAYQLKEWAGSWQTLGIAAAVAYLVGPGGLVAGLRQTSGLLAGLARLATAHPLAALVIGIAGAAATVITQWDHVRSWFSDFFDWLERRFGRLGEIAGRLEGPGKMLVSPIMTWLDEAKAFGSRLSEVSWTPGSPSAGDAPVQPGVPGAPPIGQPLTAGPGAIAPLSPQVNVHVQAPPGSDEYRVGQIAGEAARKEVERLMRQQESRRRGRLIDPE